MHQQGLNGFTLLAISRSALSPPATQRATAPAKIAATRTISSQVGRVLLVTDAWKPQVNGVVQTLERVAEHMPALGVEPVFLTPSAFRTIPAPTYPSIRLALATPAAVAREIRAAKADHVHIVTEGPLGHLARRYCLRHGVPFTTSYHTRFPEFLQARFPIPPSIVYAWLKRFHNAADATLVATGSLRTELTARGFTKLAPWTRGVDNELFHPRHRQPLGLPQPVFLYVGRVAAEKNIEAFLDLDLPGSKLVVGDGPALAELRQKYPDATFVGEHRGEELSRFFASADVFVFPSRVDTFGIVLLEAMASGLPVAAYPVTGPVDIVGPAGALSENLAEAALAALKIDRETARQQALRYSWATCAEMFVDCIRGVHAGR